MRVVQKKILVKDPLEAVVLSSALVSDAFQRLNVF